MLRRGSIPFTARRGPVHLETALRNDDADVANVDYARSPFPLDAHRVRLLPGAS